MHSYRHRYGLVDGDPAYAATQQLIAAQPTIDVPTIIVDPLYDGLGPSVPIEEHRKHFTNLVDHRLVPTGHNPPQEDPATFANAVLALRQPS
ncbi:alpha/beta hydrolase [Kribbella sp. NBC_01505]|uniref:alpha/beta fold hydrolase n=1 Tax=Kribbella sp. NBC_01505 TaxID=2903580 RepID=UPI0038655498